MSWAIAFVLSVAIICATVAFVVYVYNQPKPR